MKCMGGKVYSWTNMSKKDEEIEERVVYKACPLTGTEKKGII